MSELEFKEVKGLRDLGFTFSDAEVDAELVSIMPGLRRKRSEEENRVTASAPAALSSSAPPEEAAAPAAPVPRSPYLLEAWERRGGSGGQEGAAEHNFIQPTHFVQQQVGINLVVK
ncbi:uncharacterized protein LOC120663875 [Panicum virgatum]|uniref:Uncharacterized protein n=1 Tax=Panicum virgatum TaxID=38727 RepID=A0A8T0ULX7_PANVG|nr:uncharacterized protein LOC120663875 [Panicum virgatum]KAG2622086.1 hypothetical protein PVAP13_3NG285700 [Panicum virgatum]